MYINDKKGRLNKSNSNRIKKGLIEKQEYSWNLTEKYIIDHYDLAISFTLTLYTAFYIEIHWLLSSNNMLILYYHHKQKRSQDIAPSSSNLNQFQSISYSWSN
jgi:hypothetical protein